MGASGRLNLKRCGSLSVRSGGEKKAWWSGKWKGRSGMKLGGVRWEAGGMERLKTGRCDTE